MKCYKFFSTPYLEKIQNSVLHLVKFHEYTELNSHSSDTVWHLQKISKLSTFLEELGIDQNLKYIYIMHMAPWGQLPIHIDNSEKHQNVFALNIPIIGTTDAPMRWWKDVFVDYRYNDPLYGNNIPVFNNSEQSTIQDSTDIIHPCLCRIDIPHDVINLHDNDRIVLSLRFDPDPWHLF